MSNYFIHQIKGLFTRAFGECPQSDAIFVPLQHSPDESHHRLYADLRSAFSIHRDHWACKEKLDEALTKLNEPEESLIPPKLN